MNLIQIITELKKGNFEVEVLKSIFVDIDNNTNYLFPNTSDCESQVRFLFQLFKS